MVGLGLRLTLRSGREGLVRLLITAGAGAAALLRSVPAGQLGARFPGTMIGTIGQAGLHGAGDLAVYIGRTAAQVAVIPGTQWVTSISAAPASAVVTPFFRHAFGETLRIRTARSATFEKILYAAVAAGGGLVERKRAFTLLRGSGAQLGATTTRSWGLGSWPPSGSSR